MSSNLADEPSLANGPPSHLSMDIWKAITLPNFHDRLTPPLLQLTTDTWQTATLMDLPFNQTCIPGRPLHCIIFMTD